MQWSTERREQKSSSPTSSTLVAAVQRIADKLRAPKATVSFIGLLGLSLPPPIQELLDRAHWRAVLFNLMHSKRETWAEQRADVTL